MVMVVEYEHNRYRLRDEMSKSGRSETCIELSFKDYLTDDAFIFIKKAHIFFTLSSAIHNKFQFLFFLFFFCLLLRFERLTTVRDLQEPTSVHKTCLIPFFVSFCF
jgi:hypothetical protein